MSKGAAISAIIPSRSYTLGLMPPEPKSPMKFVTATSQEAGQVGCHHSTRQT